MDDYPSGPTSEALAVLGKLLGVASFEGEPVTLTPGPGTWTVEAGPIEVCDSDFGRAADRAYQALVERINAGA